MAVIVLMAAILLHVYSKEVPCPTGYTSKNGFTPGCKYEPCLPVNYKEIDQWERSVANKKLFGNGSLCDSFLEPGWYRPASKAGNSVPTECVYVGCGTVRPIWIKGNLPTEGEITNVTACASTYRNCCAHSYDIQVKNCSSFNVYKLVPTYGCAQAYCFGSELPCPTGYSSETGFTPGCTRTLAVTTSPRNRIYVQASTLSVTPALTGITVLSQKDESESLPVEQLKSEPRFHENSNLRDRTWVIIIGVLCCIEIIALLVYVVAKQIMKRKKMAKTGVNVEYLMSSTTSNTKVVPV